MCAFEIFGWCCCHRRRRPIFDYGRVQMILIKNPTSVQQQNPCKRQTRRLKWREKKRNKWGNDVERRVNKHLYTHKKN